MPVAGAFRLFDSGRIGSNKVLDSGAEGFSASYSVLFVWVYGRANSAGTSLALSLIFNNDAGAVYDFHYMNAQNVTQNAPVNLTAQTAAAIGLVTGTTATAGRFGVTFLTIPGYATASTAQFGTFHASVMNAGGADSFTRVGGLQYRPAVAASITRVATTATMAVGSQLVIAAI